MISSSPIFFTSDNLGWAFFTGNRLSSANGWPLPKIEPVYTVTDHWEQEILAAVTDIH